MMLYDVSRIAGSVVRHIRPLKADKSLCGMAPLALRYDIKPNSLWLRIAETTTPLEQATCHRCRGHFEKGTQG